MQKAYRSHVGLFQIVRNNIITCCKKIIADKEIKPDNGVYLLQNLEALLDLNGGDSYSEVYSKNVFESFYKQSLAIIQQDLLPHERQLLLNILARYSGDENFLGVAAYLKNDIALKHFAKSELFSEKVDQDVGIIMQQFRELESPLASVNGLAINAQSVRYYGVIDDFADNRFTFAKSLQVNVATNKYIKGYQVKVVDLLIFSKFGIGAVSVNRLEDGVSVERKYAANDLEIVGSYLAEDIVISNRYLDHNLVVEANSNVSAALLSRLQASEVNSFLVNYNGHVGVLSLQNNNSYNFINDKYNVMLDFGHPDLLNNRLRFVEVVRAEPVYAIRFNRGNVVSQPDYLLLKELHESVVLNDAQKHDIAAMSGFLSLPEIEEFLNQQVAGWRQQNSQRFVGVENMPADVVMANMHLDWSKNKDCAKLAVVHQWCVITRLLTNTKLVAQKHRSELASPRLIAMGDGKEIGMMTDVVGYENDEAQQLNAAYYGVGRKVATSDLFGRALRQVIGALAIQNQDFTGVNSVVIVDDEKSCRNSYTSMAIKQAAMIVAAPRVWMFDKTALRVRDSLAAAITIWHPRVGGLGRFEMLSADLMEHVLSFIVGKGRPMTAFHKALDAADVVGKSRVSDINEAQKELNEAAAKTVPVYNSGPGFFGVLFNVWNEQCKVLEDILYIIFVSIVVAVLVEAPVLIVLSVVLPSLLLLAVTAFSIYDKNKSEVVDNSFSSAASKFDCNNPVAAIQAHVLAENLQQPSFSASSSLSGKEKPGEETGVFPYKVAAELSC